MDNLRRYIDADQVALVRSTLRENPTLALKSDDDGRTPLHWALSKGNAELVSEVIKQVRDNSSFDIDEADAAGWTYLHISAAVSSSLVEQLLPLNPQLNVGTSTGATPLHIAISKRQERSAEMLLSAGARVGTRDRLGQSALHRASAAGYTRGIALLLHHRAPINASDNLGWTPLHYATAEGHTDAVEMLLASGADPQRENRDGETPSVLATMIKKTN